MTNKMSHSEYLAELDKQMSESEHQIRLFAEVDLLIPKYPELALLFHIPNGELRAKATAARLKACGVKSGVPDLFLPVARHGYNGLFIELKSLKKGAAPTIQQEDWLNSLSNNGYRAEIAYGWREALAVIREYISEQGKREE